MANSRYKNTDYFNNNYPIYENVLEERGVKSINQYATTSFKHLTASQKESLVTKEIVWEYADRLDKIASREYGSASYWWIIARYNNKPTDAHFERGDTVLVPHPLNLILGYYTE
jgi:hypothetical protein